MLGKGLESLIPKKKNDNEAAARPALFKEESRGGEELRFERDEESNAGSRATERLTGSGASVFSKTKPAGHLRSSESIFHIEVEKIIPNPYQPRRNFNREELVELANSIREFGIIQPLVVTKLEKETPTGSDVIYQLVAGERRLMAAKLIGLERVPAIVKRLDFHRAKLEIALVENIQRSDLNPIEAARAYARLQEEFNLTQKEIASLIGKSRETVANTIRLLNLPSFIQEALSQNKINESQARALLAVQNSVEQSELFRKFLSGRRAVKAVEEKKEEAVNPEIKYWERQLEERLGASVEIRKKEGKGRVVVKFYSEAEWQSILEKLLGEDSGEL